jgi:hypothetical protein
MKYKIPRGICVHNIFILLSSFFSFSRIGVVGGGSDSDHRRSSEGVGVPPRLFMIGQQWVGPEERAALGEERRRRMILIQRRRSNVAVGPRGHVTPSRAGLHALATGHALG